MLWEALSSRKRQSGCINPIWHFHSALVFFSNFINRFNDGVATSNIVSDQCFGPKLQANGGSVFHAGYKTDLALSTLLSKHVEEIDTIY